MKRSAFKREPLTDAQRQLKDAWKQAKSSLKPGRKRISSRRCQYKGIKFDSHWERDCYIVLEERQNRGEISDLKTNEIITFSIKNDAGKEMKMQINIDFHFYDNRLKRHVRADAKPPKKLDRQRESWFMRWNLLQLVEPDFDYVIYRQHSTWRDVDI